MHQAHSQKSDRPFLLRYLFVLLSLPLILGVIGFGLFWYSHQKTREALEQSSSSGRYMRPAPFFELEDSSGKKHNLMEFKGSVILLHFWASWCPPCLDEIQHWQELGIKFKGKAVKLLSVSLDEKWADALKVFPDKGLPAGMTSLIDPTQKISELYGSYQFPETYLITPDLRIMTKWVGPQDWNDPRLKNLIDRVVQDHTQSR